jgi:4-alpha-glucanotransferase
MLPLFSAPSSRSWGIGELADVAPLADFAAQAGFDRLLLLPIGTMAADESSPYSAASAMAIDPLFIAWADVEDFARAGGETALSPEARARLDAARRSPRVSHADVRAAKREAVLVAFDRFIADEWEQLTPRAGAFAVYTARERWWLDDYALFQSLAETAGAASWRTWPAPLRDREARALEEARRSLGKQILRHQYLQWIAEGQWQRARRDAGARGIALFGDLPFVVNLHSADVWARQREFWLDVSAGAPPDAFSADGQDWGLPTYDWATIAETDYAWIRERVRRMSALFDGLRVDHLVGLYRTYGWPPEGEPFFNPFHEPEQLAQGETILRIFQRSGREIVAEDLGTIPDFVRASLARLGVAGCKVLRWERHWHLPGQPFVDPVTYPAISAAMTGTHDTETLAEWWTRADAGERRAILALPAMAAWAAATGSTPDRAWGSDLGDALLRQSYLAGSNELFLPVQDLFGWTDRINVPGSVSGTNWTWRLPWLVDALTHEPDAVERARFAAALARERARVGVRASKGLEA